MIYLSAQPDQTYFNWQLEIQLRNFHALGITKDQIQILASFKPERGLNPDFQTFIDKNSHLANFYTYPDQREKPKYTSSIRPNILKQHFEKYPELENETLFYHDSDILFSRIPQIQDVETNAICYVSDTRNYLDIDYIRRTGSVQLLADMANIVGIPVDIIERNKQHTGGAQYILKGINVAFWEKVENDSEALYTLMKEYNKKLWVKEYPDKKEYKSKKRGIQAWCADMWAVLWNLWLDNRKVEIHPEMDFSWPYSPIEEWDRKAIQHYSGNIKEKDKFFKKNEYLNYMPWYDDSLLSIPDTNCSYKIVELIKSRKNDLDRERPTFSDSCIVFDGRDFKDEMPGVFKIAKTYLQKHLDIAIYLLVDSEQQDNTNNMLLIEQLLMQIQSYDYALRIPLEYMLDIKDIQHILSLDPKEHGTTFCPEEIYKVDSLFSETFSKVLDMDLLHLNKGKFNTKELDQMRCIHYVNLSQDISERQRHVKDTIRNDIAEPYTNEAIPRVYSLTP